METQRSVTKRRTSSEATWVQEQNNNCKGSWNVLTRHESRHWCQAGGGRRGLPRWTVLLSQTKVSRPILSWNIWQTSTISPPFCSKVEHCLSFERPMCLEWLCVCLLWVSAGACYILGARVAQEWEPPAKVLPARLSAEVKMDVMVTVMNAWSDRWMNGVTWWLDNRNCPQEWRSKWCVCAWGGGTIEWAFKRHKGHVCLRVDVS